MLDVITAIAAIFSVISVFILVIDKITQHTREKMNLIITPKKKIANPRDEKFYLYLSFSNQSSLPISILDLKIRISGNKTTSFSRSGEEDGIISVDPVSVISTQKGNEYETNTLSLTVPFVVAPYSVVSGYFAFNASGNSSTAIFYKEVQLGIITSRKSYRIEFDLNPSNFYETSYRQDGLQFGLNVFGKSYQNTSIPPDDPWIRCYPK